MITAVGQLNRPSVPELPGADSFDGPIFHSSRWPDHLDLRAKRVAIIGTGASAMQIVPAIADEVQHLTILQRSPQWAAPHRQYFTAVPGNVQFLMDHVPFYARWYRWRLAWIHNDRVHPSLQKDPSWEHADRSINHANDAHRRIFTDYITSELGDRRDLLEHALPAYPPFGKRMLLDNGWFRTLRRDNVDLIPHGAAEVTSAGVIDQTGREHEADVIVLATGFEAKRMLAPMDIVGKAGRTIRDEWGEDDPRAYLGMLAPGFPNLFFLYGPNSNLGHGGSWLNGRSAGSLRHRGAPADACQQAQRGGGPQGRVRRLQR